MHIRDLPKVEAVLKGEDGRAEFVVLKFDNYKKFVRRCDIQGAIDEADYMTRYKDVARSIELGHVKTATEHYLVTGYAEQRTARLVEADKSIRPPMEAAEPTHLVAPAQESEEQSGAPAGDNDGALQNSDDDGDEVGLGRVFGEDDDDSHSALRRPLKPRTRFRSGRPL